ncbi:hybrid sensor histidine kinase/response regulator [Plebeiibacterium sediminum]|uniref:histidine kinase n=1 Tax=Plebeiibacterium sediminum TaxID=2992112 RepID=A0AAE3M0U9_9BACT|nr:hybrid sensor histidine kinase/response regulator [Plebeiobacterium sediminum]MCW3785062.1 ATP-binding protein [Plebeiobacterium sediminum]
MKEKMQVVWTRQMQQIKKLTSSSVVFMVELMDTEASIVASTDHSGYEYDVNRLIKTTDFGLQKIAEEGSLANFEGDLKFNLKSSLTIAIKSGKDNIWGAIVLLSDQDEAYTYEIIQDVVVFAQAISDSIKLYGIEHCTGDNLDSQANSSLNFFLKSISGIPWRIDFETRRFIHIGAQAKNVIGYDIKDWPSVREWSKSIHEEDREKVLQYCYNMSLKGIDHTLEYRIPQKGGDHIWVKNIVKVIKDKNDKPVELFGVMMNITHTKQSELNLSALNNQLKYILNATNTALSIIDENCIIVFHSHEDSSLISKSCYEYFAGRSSICPHCPINSAVREKRTYVETIDDRTYQITSFPFEVNIDTWHVAEIRIDITDRVSQENEILALKDTLEFAMAAANIGFFQYDIVNQKVNSNNVVRELTGYDLSGNKVDLEWVISRFHPDDQKNILDVLQPGAAEHLDFECRILNAKNEYIWISFSGQILEFDTNNRPVRVSGVIKDITATKDLLYDLMLERNRSLRASAAKSTFLANMSHEIRTPMNAIIGFTELLGKHVIEPPFDGYLKSIKSSGKVLLDLINDLLDFEKIEAGKMVMHNENVDFRLLVNEIKQTFLVLAREKDVELIIKGADYFPKSIFIDGLKLRQILLNLVNNALKFTNEGSVTIQYDFSIHEGSGSGILSFAVTDTGIGVPSEKKKKIFEPFIQEKNQNENKYQGTGLGLSIVQNIVHKMGGSISLISELGKGSSFAVSIPDIKSSAIHEDEIELEYTESQNYLFNNELILIADPIEFNREVLRAICKNLGFRCICASDGNKVLDVLSEEVDLVILDLEINEKYQFQTIKEIRDRKSVLSLPVIAISARNKEVFKEKALKAGFSGYVSKPIIEKDLVEELSKYFTPVSIGIENYEEYNDTNDFKEGDLFIVKSQFQEKIIPIWQDLNEMLSSEKLNLFVEELQELQEKVSWTDLNAFNKKLDASIKSFDFETIQKLIRNFNTFIQNLDLK